jgi:hypothetical protein
MTRRSGLNPGRRTVRARKLGPAILLAALLMALQLGFAGAALADGGDFQTNFASATPGTYDQTTGTGGTFDDVVQQLNGGDFNCGDVVQHLTEIVVDDGATGTQAIELTFSFDTETTSGGQVGYGNVTYAAINVGDPNNNLSGNETVTKTSEQIVGEEIITTVEITGLEAGETLILSIGAQLVCNEDPANVTGNVHATLESGQTIPDGDTINTGNDDTPLTNVSALGEPPPVAPSVAVTKDCPDKVTVGGEITYTVTITNTGDEPLEDIQVVDSIFGDVSDLFADTLDVGESDTVEASIIAPPSLAGQTLTNEITVTATGSESTEQATATASCSVGIGRPPSPTPTLPVTGLSGGLPLVWILVVAFAFGLAGAGLRLGVRRRS